ncbi:putative glycosyl transferase, partial [Methylorubrum extorquens DSM 13060]
MAERAGSIASLAGRALPVTGADGAELRIDLSGTDLGGAWVSVTWRDAGSGGIARA